MSYASDALIDALGRDVDRLGESIDKLREENAILRDELDQWHRLTAGIELPEYPITEFKPKDLERENAKLRKLCAEMYPYAKAYLQEWRIVGYIDSKSYDWFLQLRKLGVEVGE